MKAHGKGFDQAQAAARKLWASEVRATAGKLADELVVQAQQAADALGAKGGLVGAKGGAEHVMAEIMRMIPANLMVSGAVVYLGPNPNPETILGSMKYLERSLGLMAKQLAPHYGYELKVIIALGKKLPDKEPTE